MALVGVVREEADDLEVASRYIYPLSAKSQMLRKLGRLVKPKWFREYGRDMMRTYRPNFRVLAFL